MSTLAALHTLLSNTADPTRATWTAAADLARTVQQQRLDGTLLKQLRDEHDADNEARLLDEIREVLADECLSNADYVVFTAAEYDNGFFLNTTYAEVMICGDTTQVDFGGEVNDLLTALFSVVGPDSAVGVNLHSDDIVAEDHPDEVRDTMQKLTPREPGSPAGAADGNDEDAAGAAPPHVDAPPTTGMPLLDQLRANDPRIDVVVAYFVAQRLGWTLDEPVEDVMPHILSTTGAGSFVIGAHRLLEQLDAVTTRGLGDRDPLVRYLRTPHPRCDIPAHHETTTTTLSDQ